MRKLLLGAIAAAAVAGGSSLRAEEDDLFTKLDTNKDGFITTDEVDSERKPLFERMLRNADKDGDKKLTKEEFQAGLKGTDEPRQPLQGGSGGPGRPGGGQFNPREIFARMDADKDGKISKTEAGDRMRENFDRIDANGDGSVSEEEFTRSIAGFAGGRPGTPPGAPGRGPIDARQAEELFNRTDANSDGKLTKDEVPEDRREGFTRMLERIGAESVTKEQFVRFLTAQGGQPNQPRPDQPRPDQPRPDQPRPDQPRPDQPRPDQPRPGQPRPGDGPPRFGGFGPPPVIAAIDADGDGELSSGEIEAASKALMKLDKNGDGKLSREELAPQLGVFRPGQPGQPGQPGAPAQPGIGRFSGTELIERYQAADANKDGKISKDEVPERLKENFDRVDTNSDGFIDEGELKQLADRIRQGFGNRPNRPDGNRPPGSRPNRDGDNPPRRPEAEKP